jgi:hypothetical protein
MAQHCGFTEPILLHPGKQEIAKIKIDRVLQGGDVPSRECRHRRMDGLE